MRLSYFIQEALSMHISVPKQFYLEKVLLIKNQDQLLSLVQNQKNLLLLVILIYQDS